VDGSSPELGAARHFTGSEADESPDLETIGQTLAGTRSITCASQFGPEPPVRRVPVRTGNFLSRSEKPGGTIVPTSNILSLPPGSR
jgi:hypothetical protein